MKKLIIFILAAMISAPVFQSCNTKGDYADLAALVTVKKSLEAAGFYGLCDNGDKIAVGNIRVPYEAKDGQRAIMYFSELETPVPGYRYNADVFGMNNILTKEIVELDMDQKDTLGRGGAGITRAWIAGGYLNIEYTLMVDPTVGGINYINLVNNLQKDESTDSFDVLEFRNKPVPDMEHGMGVRVPSVVCFRLGDFDPEISGKEGLIINYISTMEDNRSITVKPGKDATTDGM